MLTYILRRLLSLAITMLIATLVIFAALELVPGDPAQMMLGVNATPESLAALRDQMGLDRPAPLRYLAWLGGMVTGDFGTSFTYSVPVSGLIAERLALSLPLAFLALFLSTLIALPVGLIAAARRGRPTDTTLMTASQIGIAIPNFWFALLLVYVFAVSLRWVPAGGFPGWSAGFWPALASLGLPAIALALPQSAILARVARSALIETLGEDYIRTARAKGLPGAVVIRRHALKNAMIPVLTILGLQFAFLLAGTIIIENVFYLPGLGRLIFQAITQRDLIVVEGVVVLLVATIITVNFLIDIAYGAIDPRLRAR